ncbi:hypothetical protein EDD17DRAFT_1557421, partial [Pisolithus thermaeus]
MGRMRFPSLSIHGIRGTSTPMTAEDHNPCQHLRKVQSQFAKLNSKNQIKVNYEGGGLPWVGDRSHWNYQAADAATKVRIHLTCLNGRTG